MTQQFPPFIMFQVEPLPGAQNGICCQLCAGQDTSSHLPLMATTLVVLLVQAFFMAVSLLVVILGQTFNGCHYSVGFGLIT